MALNWSCLLLFFLLGSLKLDNVAAVASITTSSIEFGGNDSICPVEVIDFNCTGVELLFLEWLKNGIEIITFTDEMELNMLQTPSPGVTVVLNSFDVQGAFVNMSSTLSLNTTSVLTSGDNITCGDRRAESRSTITANYLFIAPPVVPDYIYSINGRSSPNSDVSTVNLTISLNETYLAENVIDRYCVYVEGGGGVCPPNSCLSPDEVYTCNGLRSGDVYDVRLRAVNCDTQYGEETDVLTLTPIVPPPLGECESYPVYNQSNGMLIGIGNTWNELENVTRLSVDLDQDPEYYIIFYKVISATTPTTVSVRPDGDVCDDDGVCVFVVRDEFNPGTQYEVSMAPSNVVGRGTSIECNNAIRSQNSIVTVSSSGPSIIDGNSTIRCQFESTSDNTTKECELCYSTLSGLSCESQSDFTCEIIALQDGETAVVFDEVTFPYSSPEGPYGPFCYQVTVRIGGATVAMVTGEAYTGCTPYALGTQITPEIDERCTSLNTSTFLEASITGENSVFCYEGTLQGSRAYLICDSGYVPQEEEMTQQAVCQRDGSWRSVPMCVKGSSDDVLELLNIILIAVGGVLWLINVFLFVTGLVLLIKLIKSQFNGRKRVWHFLFIILLILSLILLVAAVGLWVAFGVIVGLYQDNNDVEERESFESLRDKMCIAAFAVSVTPLLTTSIALLLYLLVPKCLSSSGSMAISVEKPEVTEFKKPEDGGGGPPLKSEDHLETIEMSEPRIASTREYRQPPIQTYPGQVPDVDGTYEVLSS